MMRVINSTSGMELAGNLTIADNCLSRLKGWLGRSALPTDEGLLIKPCIGIHTFCLRFPIDVLFLSDDNIVLAMKKGMSANRLTPLYLTASSVLELPAGRIEETKTHPGDLITIC